MCGIHVHLQQGRVVDLTEKMEDFRFLQWLGGQIDGDGSVGMFRTRIPFICMKKAEKGKHTLLRIQSHVGGDIYLTKRQTDHQQACYSWTLRGCRATPLIQALIPFLKLKKGYAEIVARWRPSMHKFTVSGKGKEHRNTSMKVAAQIVGRTPPTILKHMRAAKACNGYTITKPENMTEALYQQLQVIKQQPNDPVAHLHPSYVAGFVDAEGCIRTQGSNLRVTIAQKEPTILYGLQHSWGGSVIKEKNRDNWVLTLCAASARAFLATIKSDVYEKADQVELALQFNKSNWKELAPKMKAMRGGQL